MTVRANSVQVDKLFRARCHLPGCDWVGELRSTYQDANYDRIPHMAEHAQAEQEGWKNG